MVDIQEDAGLVNAHVELPGGATMITDEMIEKRIVDTAHIHIAMCAFPENNSLFPLVRLAAAMEKRGHTITFMTWKYGEEKTKKLLQLYDLKADVYTSDPGWTQKEVRAGIDGSGKMFGGIQKCLNQVKSNLLTEIKPDLMICDYLDFVHALAADQLFIPIMINSSMPLSVLGNISHFTYPTSENSFALCGCAIVCPRMDHFFTYYSMPFKMSPFATKAMRDLPYRYIITNVFAGFDKAIHTQPNLVMTGPVMDPDLTDAKALLDKKSPEIADFLNSAFDSNEPVVYVSLGNTIKW